MRTLLILSILLYTFALYGSTDPSNYPKDYFASPVNHEIKLSGTFGELRSNHFHAGLDIKSTKGVPGDPIFASAEGFISRITVKSGGYGKAIYMEHPNGYTTVYAHLDKFAPEIEAYVKKQQYANRSFNVNLFPPSNLFSFKKKEEIGKMGNSGHSYGPHLHFEIRETNGQVPLNPMHFGIEVTDDVAPVIRSLKVYLLNDRNETIKEQKFNVSQSGKNFTLSNPNLQIGAWRVGFSVKTFDQMNQVRNLNGIYKIKMYVDEVLYYAFSMDRITYGETRYLNAHLDYKDQVLNKSQYHRCYKLAGNRLNIYQENINSGIIPIYKDQAQNVRFEISDEDGNVSKLTFDINRKEDMTAQRPQDYEYILLENQENYIENDKMSLYVPQGALYENVYFNFDSTIEQSSHIFSPVLQVHEKSVPLHKYAQLRIKSTSVPSHLRTKAFIASCSNDGKFYSNIGGEWEGDWLKSKTRNFGQYCIMIDTIAPYVSAFAFRVDMRGRSLMSFKISDQFSSFDYEAYVDGQWILMEYDPRKNRITHHFDGRIGPGEHQLKIIARDQKGNEKIYERNFIL